LTRIIEKRQALHRNLQLHKQQNTNLKVQISQLQALANIGVNTAMIAHEINNLLTPLSNYADLALLHSDDMELTEKALKKTSRNCQRASKVMQSILAVANGETEKKQIVNLAELVDEIFSCLCRDFSKDNIALKVEIPNDLTIFAVPVPIQQVLMNLILNSRDAMITNGGILTVKATDNGNSVEIEVADTGKGISDVNIGKIFSSFFTTKKDAEKTSGGSGLGLAFCKKAVQQHNGTISFRSDPGKATVFKIILPKLQ
jgi:signal transduction histidine kinase